jgi:hypothetical protein
VEESVETGILIENMPQCLFVDRKSHMTWPGLELWFHRVRSVEVLFMTQKHLSYWIKVCKLGPHDALMPGNVAGSGGVRTDSITLHQVLSGVLSGWRGALAQFMSQIVADFGMLAVPRFSDSASGHISSHICTDTYHVFYFTSLQYITAPVCTLITE